MSSEHTCASASTSTTSPPMYTPPPPNSICFTTIPVHSLSRAQGFYTSVFDWKFLPSPPPSSSSDSPVTRTVFHTAGNIMGTLYVVSEATKLGSHENREGTVNYVLVEDVDATLEKVKQAGGRVEQEKWVEGGHTELSLFRDTEGNLSGLLKWLM